MGRKLLRTSSWWIIGLISVFSLAESQRLYGGISFQSLSRTFPKIQPKLPVVREQQNAELSVRPRPIVVKCHSDSMEVVVQADMFNTGLEVESRHLRLGSDFLSEASACGAFPSGEAEFTIKAQLTDCGTKLASTKEEIIYSNVLVYSSEPSSDGLLRLDGATVPVECHYDRRCAVDGISLQPTWIPFVSRALADDQIDFNLRLMTDDWQLQRESYAYFLGDPIHFEASAVIAKHVPLRVYVDHCVATATPDAEATLRYDFIDNNGCLADAYLTNSSSHFLQGGEEHMLRFQLDAFRFYREPSNQVYITCYMKAVRVNLTVGSQNKACSLIEKRWRSVDGNHQACRSCEMSYRVEEPLSTVPPTATMITKPSSAPTSQESFFQKKPEQRPAKYIRFHPGTHQSQYNKHHQSYVKVMKRRADYRADRTTLSGPLMVLASSQYVSRSTDSKTKLSPKTKVT